MAWPGCRTSPRRPLRRDPITSSRRTTGDRGAEAGHLVARQGVTRDQANAIVLKLLEKYEDQIADALKGKPFQECYNVRTARPLPWYLDMYKKVKDEVAAMGVAFLY